MFCFCQERNSEMRNLTIVSARESIPGIICQLYFQKVYQVSKQTVSLINANWLLVKTIVVVLVLQPGPLVFVLLSYQDAVF